MEAAIEAAYAAIGAVHRLMSFHEETSDVSRINRSASIRAVEVHPWTFNVLVAALDLQRHSRGWFDIRVATAMQRKGMLPSHGREFAGEMAAWPNRGQIELLKGNRVRFNDRATRIDLGGIAKGFAVDRAIDAMRESGVPFGLVNAGGDLAAFGPEGVPVAIRNPANAQQLLCHIELRNSALASSGATFDPVTSSQNGNMTILDPSTGEAPCTVRGTTIRAPCCLLADALTKVAVIGGHSSAPLLRRYDASALLVSADGDVYVTPEWNDAAILAA